MSDKNYVRNMTQLVNDHPILGLAIAGAGGIEASEAAGQRQLVASEVLPTEIQPYYVGTERRWAKPLLESWGFEFGEPVDGDPIFQHAKLPAGWMKEGGSHAMWSYVVDDKGCRRCEIFYKAAFYDRSAHMDVCSRYVATVEYEKENDLKSPARGVVKEGNTLLFAGPWHSTPKDGQAYETRDAARKVAAEWFAANLPADLAEQWALP